MTAKATFACDENSIPQMVEFIKSAFPKFSSGRVRVEVKDADSSTQGMKGLWRTWMAETSKWMAEQGATMPLYYRPNGEPFGKRPFNKDDAHECFMRTWGGVDVEGDREHQEKVGKGEMLHIMTKHEAWAVEKGISLTIPQDSQYMQMREAA